MGAVIWLMNSLNQDKLIPGLIILVGIALGLWMIGNLYEHSATNGKKWTVRVFALVLSGVICGYGWRLQYRSHELPWGEFSTAEIEKLRSEGKPILIDFTANWCGICKSNELTALNRPATIDFVNRHGIVTKKADFTNEDPEIARWLAMCNQDTVPLTLIFPKGRSDQAIPLRGAYTQTTLLTKLQQAVSDRSEASESETRVASDGGTTTTQAIHASEGAAAMR
jgi:thiol:disulfide interchange protein DsbD